MLIHRIKKNIYFFLNLYKMFIISIEIWGKYGVEKMVVNGIKWVNEKHIKEGYDHANLPLLTNQNHSDFIKHIYKLLDEPKIEPNSILSREGLAVKIMMDCRTTEALKFKRKLGFNLHDVINTKEQTLLELIKDAFEG